MLCIRAFLYSKFSSIFLIISSLFVEKPISKSLTTTIESSTCIDIELAKLWEIISMPGILEKTHPFCQTNAIIRWDCESSIDTIVYYN